MEFLRLPSYTGNNWEATLYGDHQSATQCLVFYHGTNLCATGIILDWQATEMAKMNPNCCIVALTRPGYSGLVAQPSDTSLEATAASHAKILHDLGLNPLAVIGHSGGSLAAYHLARHLRANGYRNIRLVMIAPTASDDILERQGFRGQLKFQAYRNLFRFWPRLAKVFSSVIGWLNRTSPVTQFSVWAGEEEWMNKDAEMKGALVSSIKHAAQGPHSGRGFALDFQSFVAGWGHLTYFDQAWCLSFRSDSIVPPDMVHCLVAELGGTHVPMSGGHFAAWDRRHPEIWSYVLQIALGLED